MIGKLLEVMEKRKNTFKRGGWVEQIADWLRLSKPFETTVMFDGATLNQKLLEIKAASGAILHYKAMVSGDDYASKFMIERIRQYPKAGLEAYLLGECLEENDGPGIYVVGRAYPAVAAIFLSIFVSVFLFFAFERNIFVGLITLLVTGFYIKASLDDRDKTLEFFMDYLHDKAKYKNDPGRKRPGA